GGGGEPRREIVSYRKAALAYAHADPAVQPALPAFLSAFAFPKAFKTHFDATASTAGYAGPVGVPSLNFDIDRADLDAAIRDTRRLAACRAAPLPSPIARPPTWSSALAAGRGSMCRSPPPGSSSRHRTTPASRRLSPAASPTRSASASTKASMTAFGSGARSTPGTGRRD